jgi:hypothetical protein
MRRRLKQISVIVELADGRQFRMELDEVRSVGGAFLTAIEVYPEWDKITMTVVRAR